MSEKWEIVGKAKKSKSSLATKDSSDKKGSSGLAKKPTYEEILPKYALKNIRIDNVNKENKKPNNGTVKSVKKVEKVTQPPPAKVKGVSVPRKPVNIEAAFEQFNTADLDADIEVMKANFPSNHLVWLKGLCAYLNSKLNVKNQPSLIDKPSNYPSNIVPENVKAIIYNLLNEAGHANVQYFFDQTLTSLAMDLSNNVNCIGHSILLQLIAHEWPTVCVQNLAKNAILRNSYQNRSSIGLSLLWALGQGGYKDATVGCRVWQNIMVPVLEMKSYSKWVCEYVYRMLNSANDSINLVQSEFFTIFDELLLQRNGLPKDCQKLLTSSASVFLSKYIKSASKLHNVFLTLFKRLNAPKTIALEPSLIECLVKESECFKVWKMHYRKNIVESKQLLSYLGRNWTNLPASIKQNANLKDFLGYIQLQNGSFKPQDQQVHEEIIESVQSIQGLQEKSQKKTKSSSSICPWLFGSFLLIGIISSLLAYDTHIHGGVFAKSATGKFLQQTGTLPYVEVAWTKTMSTSARGYQWAEKNVPVYVNQTCTAVKPYTAFLRDAGIVGWNFVLERCEAVKLVVLEKTPIVVNFIDQYAPGFPLKIQEFSISLWKGLCSSSAYVYHSSCDFFKTKVFVGNLSPENLSKALNQTQIAAAEYYSWFHKKVDAYAKIQ
ncbi:hypothetical protein HA402_006408 [Bradysia odoriphaga]|nr:hypothetical protein HA402_006408 [Bradysia odoriphaga]